MNESRDLFVAAEGCAATMIEQSAGQTALLEAADPLADCALLQSAAARSLVQPETTRNSPVFTPVLELGAASALGAPHLLGIADAALLDEVNKQQRLRPGLI